MMMTLPFEKSTSFARPVSSGTFAASPCALFPSLLAIHSKNRSRVAIIPFPFVKSLNWLLSRLISAHTHSTYSFVSARRSLLFGTFAALGPLLSSTFVTSRQSRYMRYGSSNLTLKKNDDPAGYGESAAGFAPFVGGTVTCVRTTKPSSASPFHLPARAISSVNALTSGIVLRTVEGVGMKPNSCAKASTTGWGCVWNARVLALRPCRCRPVLSGAIGRTCSSKESSQS